jgi:hypothetical protein
MAISDEQVEQARIAVREHFNRHRNDLVYSTLKMHGQMAAWRAGTRQGKWFEIQMTGEDSEVLSELVQSSEENPVAWEACKQIAEQCIKRGDPIPELLGDFVLGVLNDQNKRPTKKKIGADPYRRQARDHVIMMAVWKASEFLPEYAEGMSRGTSACDVVAETLPDYGIELSSASVLKMWKMLKKRIGPQARPEGEK